MDYYYPCFVYFNTYVHLFLILKQSYFSCNCLAFGRGLCYRQCKQCWRVASVYPELVVILRNAWRRLPCELNIICRVYNVVQQMCICHRSVRTLPAAWTLCCIISKSVLVACISTFLFLHNLTRHTSMFYFVNFCLNTFWLC